MIRFGATASSDVTTNAITDSDTSCSQYFEVTRLIDSIDLVDGGKNYTFADLDFSKGLVVPTGKVNIEDLARPIMSPFGGHGSDPVKELGASSLMIVKSYSQTEKGKAALKRAKNKQSENLTDYYIINNMYVLAYHDEFKIDRKAVTPTQIERYRTYIKLQREINKTSFKTRKHEKNIESKKSKQVTAN